MIPDALRVTWLGTAGFALEHGGKRLLLDPFVTRCGLREVILGPHVAPSAGAIDRFVPRADYVVCGHTHYDHALDAPAIARRDGAVLVGSQTLARIARASGVPDAQVREVPPAGARIELPPFTVTLAPSTHGRWLAGRFLWAGCLDRDPVLPMRASGWVDGGVFTVHVEAGGAAVLHAGSAGIVDAALDGLRASVVLACLAGRRHTPRYLERLVRATGARRVVASHFDDFFRPLDAIPRVLPGTGVASFPREVRELGAEPVVPAFFEQHWIAPER